LATGESEIALPGYLQPSPPRQQGAGAPGQGARNVRQTGRL